MAEKKRGAPPSKDTTKQTKRQRKAAAQSSSTKKPSSSNSKQTIPHIDTPIPDLLPHQRIDLIANLSEAVLEDPTSAVSSSRTTLEQDTTNGNEESPSAQYTKTQSKLQTLLLLASPSTNGHDGHAARLAILSLLAIYTDILPSYRIRLPTVSELSVVVGKDVKKQWDYEKKLLSCYQRYLSLLEKIWEGGKYGSGIISDGGAHSPPTTLAATAILSLSQLLISCYNFNFRSNLLSIVVRNGNIRHSTEVRSACCNALRVMFERDTGGEASLEAVRLIGKLVKLHDGKKKNKRGGGRMIHSDLLETWMALPLRVHEDEAVAAKLATKLKNKQRKGSQQQKDLLEIEKELKEGDASIDKIDLAKNQSDMLHCVTVSYFRILKDCCVTVGGTDAEKSDGYGKKKESGSGGIVDDLLPVCLRGLAKFSHLIHVDAISDLMDVLKDLLKESHNLPLEAAIHCILCALKTLRGPGRDAIPVDPKEYLIPLYNELSRLGIYDYQLNLDSSSFMEYTTERSNSSGSNMEKSVSAAIQCLDHAFAQRRELSASRLCAFLKRIASTSLHCPPHTSAPLIASARQLSLRYASSPKVTNMLENEQDIIYSEGTFVPEATDPEHSNAHATSLWELSLLKFHVNPTVADHASNMAEGKLLKLPGESPSNIGEVMGRNVKEGYIMHKAVVKKHPLHQAAATVDGDGKNNERKKSRQRRNQNQVRFITPRKTGNWHLLEASSVSML